jgi:hypothetical protein
MRIQISQIHMIHRGQKYLFRRVSRVLQRDFVPPIGSTVVDFGGEEATVERAVFNDSLDFVTLHLGQRRATEEEIERLRAAGFTIQS